MSLRDEVEGRTAHAGARGEPPARYEDDGCTWALRQAELLRAGNRREYDKREGALAIVLQHPLTWDIQLEGRSRGWARSVKQHRARVWDRLRDLPDLKGTLDRVLCRAYGRGLSGVSSETDAAESRTPPKRPYEWDEPMKRDTAWPDE